MHNSKKEYEDVSNELLLNQFKELISIYAVTPDSRKDLILKKIDSILDAKLLFDSEKEEVPELLSSHTA